MILLSRQTITEFLNLIQLFRHGNFTHLIPLLQIKSSAIAPFTSRRVTSGKFKIQILLIIASSFLILLFQVLDFVEFNLKFNRTAKDFRDCIEQSLTAN